jgi:hypothetical protein
MNDDAESNDALRRQKFDDLGRSHILTPRRNTARATATRVRHRGVRSGRTARDRHRYARSRERRASMIGRFIRGFCALCVVVACARRHAEVIEIPSTYRGWIEITYSDNCKQAPEARGGRRLLKIDRGGKLCVGSPWESGTATDEFYFVDDNGRTRLHEDTPATGMIWGRTTRQSNLGPGRVDRFYVGTEADYRRDTLKGNGRDSK